MAISQLTSRNNPILKTIRLITSGSRRAPKQLAVAEGIRTVEEVHKAGCKIEAAVISDRFGSTEREEALLKIWASHKNRVYRTDSRLFQSLSDLQAPQGVIALVHIAFPGLAGLPLPPRALIVYACGIQDPGNLGTLIRTAAAAGASLVCTSIGTVTARNPKAIRASAGNFFHLPVVEHIEVPAFLNFCRQSRIHVYRTDVREGKPYTEANLTRACAFVLGNEGSGIADSTLEGTDSLHIPMAEGVESLNVATSGAILLFEALRQRAAGGNNSEASGAANE